MAKILIVGCGFAGAVIAERLASAGHKITIFEKRDHIGGNCYDLKMKGVLVHKYGPHRFRSNSNEVWDYLSKFTKWRKYNLENKSLVNGKYYTYPINRNTLNEVFKTDLKTDEDAKTFLDLLKVPIENPSNSEEYVLSQAGRILYEMFYKDYTIKQWGIHPRKLSPEVCGRVPIRFNTDNRYVTGKEGKIPSDGYTAMFNKILNHKNIKIHMEKIHLGNLYSNREEKDYEHLIWTGRIDEFFGFKYGALPYRSLRFEFHHYEEEFEQKWYKVAYPTFDVPYTRDIEFKYLTGQKCASTMILREFPMDFGDPYTPILTDKNKELYSKYYALTKNREDVSFIGRLAEYKYYDMDDIVIKALEESSRLIKKFREQE